MMIKIAAGILLVACAATGCSRKDPLAIESEDVVAPFRIDLEVDLEEGTNEASIYFIDQKVIIFDPPDLSSIKTVFDLGENSWTQASPRRTATFLECQQWARETERKTRGSIAKSDDETIDLVLGTFLDPAFDVSESEGVLRLWNDLMSYRFWDPLPLEDSQRQLFFRYDRLNAYHKSMTESKMLPYPQLAVSAELHRREIVPGRLEMVFKKRDGETKIEVSNSIAVPDAEEVARVRGAVEDFK